MPPAESPPGVELLPLEQFRAAELLPLLATSLGDGPRRTEEFWTWKHQGSPFGPSPGLVAVAGGRPVALRVFLRWTFQRGAERVPAVRAVDTATAPDWQRRGLFRRLTLELARRVEAAGTHFVFNTPNRRSGPGYLSMGWRAADPPPLLVRPLRPLSLLRHLLFRRAPQLPAAPGSRVGELLEAPGLDAFLRHLRTDDRLHTSVDAAYLAWRYAAAPELGYRAVWDLDGAGGAVLVLRPRLRRGAAELGLVEVLVGEDVAGAAAARRLLAELTRRAAADGFDHLTAIASPATAERRVLRRAGFLPAAPLAPQLVVRPLETGRETAALALAQGTRRLTLGDLELF